MTVWWARDDSRWPASKEEAVLERLPEQMARTGRVYSRWQDRQAHLVGRLLLGSALARAKCCLTLADLTLSDRGRPCLPIIGDFNISHSGGRVVCAWTDQGRVGVDLERYRTVRAADYGPVLSEAEQRCIRLAADPHHEFVRLWTRKEAVAKASGLGIASGALPDAAASPVAFGGLNWAIRESGCSDYALSVATDLDEPWRLEEIEMSIESDGTCRPRPQRNAWSPE